MPDLVYSAHTGSHPVLVTDEGDLRCLRFGTGERQSCIDRRTPWVLQLAYTRWMMTALLLPENPQRLLLFGLGGGAMVHFLLHHLPQARLDVVEREGLVIDLARRFFALPHPPVLHLHHSEASAFLEETDTFAYQVVLVDIFAPGGLDGRQHFPVGGVNRLEGFTAGGGYITTVDVKLLFGHSGHGSSISEKSVAGIG